MTLLVQRGLSAAVLALTGCAAAAPPAPPSQPPSVPPSAFVLPSVPADPAVLATRDAVERQLAAEVAKAGLPSLAFGVIGKGGLVYFVGLGKRESAGGEVTADTVYRIGSITKTFTGLSLLQLRDAGKLGLDDPAAKLFPELASARSPTTDGGPIRIRHLVTHTSGLPRLGKLDYAGGHEMTPEELRKAAEGVVLEFAPGTRAQYSNLAMAFAGQVVARASGEPYRAYVNAHVLGPLGMTHTVWDREAVPPDKLAEAFAKKDGALVPVAQHWRLGASESAGGLYSSVADMSRWVAFQLSAWPPRDGADTGPLQRSSVRESQLALSGFGRGDAYGVNWLVTHDPALGGHVVFHNGGTEGYSAALWMLPGSGIGVIALSPHTSELDGISHRALATIYAALRPEPKLGPPAQAALDRVRTLLAAADAAVADAFSPDFLKAVPTDKVLEILASVRSATGPCTTVKVLRADTPTTAQVELVCERASRWIKLAADPAPPHRMLGLLITTQPP